MCDASLRRERVLVFRGGFGGVRSNWKYNRSGAKTRDALSTSFTSAEFRLCTVPSHGSFPPHITSPDCVPLFPMLPLFQSQLQTATLPNFVVALSTPPMCTTLCCRQLSTTSRATPTSTIVCCRQLSAPSSATPTSTAIMSTTYDVMDLLSIFSIIVVALGCFNRGLLTSSPAICAIFILCGGFVSTHRGVASRVQY